MSTQPLTSQQYHMADLDEAIEFYYQQGWTDGLLQELLSQCDVVVTATGD